MQTNHYPDPNLYSNIHDETECINKYAPVRKLSQTGSFLAVSWIEKPSLTKS